MRKDFEKLEKILQHKEFTQQKRFEKQLAPKT